MSMIPFARVNTSSSRQARSEGGREDDDDRGLAVGEHATQRTTIVWPSIAGFTATLSTVTVPSRPAEPSHHRVELEPVDAVAGPVPVAIVTVPRGPAASEPHVIVVARSRGWSGFTSPGHGRSWGLAVAASQLGADRARLDGCRRRECPAARGDERERDHGEAAQAPKCRGHRLHGSPAPGRTREKVD
jgi:hypothetical protein